MADVDETPDTNVNDQGAADANVDDNPPAAPTPPVEPEQPSNDPPDNGSGVDAPNGEQPSAPPTPPAADPPENLSPRQQKRLEKLNNVIGHITGNRQKQPARETPGINYRDMIEADDAVYGKLDEESKKYGQSQYTEGLAEAQKIQFHTRLEIDTPRVHQEHPILNNKNQETFNPYVADAINNWYLAMVGYDPETKRVENADLRYGDFVDGIMELAESIASEQTQATRQNIQRTVAQTGLRPDGNTARGMDLTKAPEDMTIEELNAAAQASMPRDSAGRFVSAR